MLYKIAQARPRVMSVKDMTARHAATASDPVHYAGSGGTPHLRRLGEKLIYLYVANYVQFGV